MPFDQSQILAVNPPKIRYGDLYVSWTSGAPKGTWFQVYLDGKLSWNGTRRHAVFPVPPAPVRITIGTVLPSEHAADFSASIPPAPQRTLKATWQGGTYLGTLGRRNVVGFAIYASAAPAGFGSGGFGAGGFGTGLPTIPGKPTSIVHAYAGNAITDGFGMGGFGAGGFGAAAASYKWESGPLGSGIYGLSVGPLDDAGNVGGLRTAYQTLSVPPASPGASQVGSRLSYRLAGFGVGPFGGGGFGSQGFGDGPFGGGVGFGQSQAILTWNP